VFKIFHVNIRVQPGHNLEIYLRPVLFHGFDNEGLAKIHVRHALKRKGFGTVQPQRFPVFAVFELQGQNAHAHQIAPVNAFAGFRNHRLHARQGGSLGCPVAG